MPVKVSELMTQNPVTVRPDQSLRDVALLMRQNDCGCVPVRDTGDGRLIGVVTDRDIVTRAIAAGRNGETTIRDVMTKDPACCGPDDSIDRVEAIMSERQVRRVPVIDGKGRIVGIVAQADLARAANGSGSDAVSEHDLANVVECVSQPSGATPAMTEKR